MFGRGVVLASPGEAAVASAEGLVVLAPGTAVAVAGCYEVTTNKSETKKCRCLWAFSGKSSFACFVCVCGG